MQGREEALRGAFLELDADGSGHLDAEELAAALASAGFRTTKHQVRIAARGGCSVECVAACSLWLRFSRRLWSFVGAPQGSYVAHMQRCSLLPLRCWLRISFVAAEDGRWTLLTAPALQVIALARQLDTDKSGAVDVKEFLAALDCPPGASAAGPSQ